MKQSLSFYIVQLILKLKGIKKDFSQDPIPFKKIRKDDVPYPKGNFFRQKGVQKIEVLSTSITVINETSSSNKLLIFIHGGAFICGPAKHHWDSLKEIVAQTDCVAWMCDYPKAPEHKIGELSQNIDAVYKQALNNYSAEQIILVGDSVGGTLITALTQRLVQQAMKLPKKIILVCPVMDATMTNPAITAIDKIDPMLSSVGVRSAKKMCAGTESLTSPMISPLNGSFKNFPETLLFMAKNDITYPDQLLAIHKMKAAGLNLEVIEGSNMPHIWPFLPVMKEAKSALKIIIDSIKK